MTTKTVKAAGKARATTKTVVRTAAARAPQTSVPSAGAVPVGPDFQVAAGNCVRWLLMTRQEFTSDEVWNALGTFYPEVAVREPRHLATVVIACRRNGLLYITSTFVRSRRKACHSRPIPVYVSRVFDAAGRKPESPLTTPQRVAVLSP